MSYNTYQKYASLAARLECGQSTVEQIVKAVGVCGLTAIQTYIAAGKPDFSACEAAGFSF